MKKKLELYIFILGGLVLLQVLALAAERVVENSPTLDNIIVALARLIALQAIITAGYITALLANDIWCNREG